MIYSDPVISQLATTYPVGKSLITIPKVKVRGTVTNTDGTHTTWLLPRDTHLVRSTAKSISLLPSFSNNLYTLSNLTVEAVNVNKRYFIITDVHVHDGIATQYTVPISIRADARGQLATKFTFIDTINGNLQVEGSLIGNIDFNAGIVQYSVTFASASIGVFSAQSATSSVVFSPRNSDIGRVKVSLDIQGWDVSID